MSRRNNPKKLLWASVGLFALIVSYLSPQVTSLVTTGAPAPEPGYYKVVDFADGDTITVDMNGKREKVRLIGVDTPEKQHPDKPKQCYSHQASEFTKQRITAQGGVVRLVADPTNDPRDRYNRLLRYVYLKDNTLLNKELIATGHGFEYTLFPFQKKDEFITTQAAAKSAKKGLWGACTTTKDGKTWRTQPMSQSNN
ncbi:MAG TPA: thermonuclease family protein [Verrucomicrobiae bacterium]|nr:thermonuclease family protein [Verrucomicrobiae bacterium]